MIEGIYGLITSKIGHQQDLTSIEIFRAISALEKEKHPEAERVKEWFCKEFLFWDKYVPWYVHLLKGWVNRSLMNTIRDLMLVQPGDLVLDVGCGPLQVSLVAYTKCPKINIVGMDIILDPARQRMKDLAKAGINLPVVLEYGSITDSFRYPRETFDVVGANLILTYITDHRGLIGKDAVFAALREVFRILKEGGHVVLSSPRKGVQFKKVYWASLIDILNIWQWIKNADSVLSRIKQSKNILGHALEIQKKGERGVYTFLDPEEMAHLMSEIGFVNISWKKSFAGQVWVFRAFKP